jgi:putative FmdB family regulatory protein
VPAVALQEETVPTYQYACTACGERHEAVQSFTDAPLTECPACSGTLRKVFSAVGVVFKGSGFYKTDSRSSGGQGKADDKSGGKSEKASESSSSTSGTGDKTPATASAGSSSSSGSSSSGSSSSGGSASSGASAPASKTG